MHFFQPNIIDIFLISTWKTFIVGYQSTSKAEVQTVYVFAEVSEKIF